MNRQSRGLLLYIIVAVVLVSSFMYLSTQAEQEDTYTNGEYETALEDGSIFAVTIRQNQQTPTGQLDIVLESGERKVLNVSDVKAEQERLAKYDNISDPAGHRVPAPAAAP